MKKIILAIVLSVPGLVHAGTITTYFSPLGTITFSSNTAGSTTQAFTGADDTLLDVYNSNWINMPHATGDVDECIIKSNTIRANAAFGECYAMYNPSSSDSSQLVMKPFADANVGKGPCVRAGAGAGSNKSGYCANFIGSPAAGNWIRMGINKDGSYLDEYSVAISSSSDHTVKIKASGSGTVTLHVYIDAVDLGAKTDSVSPLGAGKPGFHTTGNGDATVTGIDDWTDTP